ncbi:GNAT family N-acetyltransferase [Nissabacter sp. SGAir0207]|uniref:GNAT family N-acetyltransferase n=1 Tax=Nissabacter sp. SGAir0207 TaxID=2126321 RepID=UPI0010CCD64E|nr:GNAT family N-acetyltransferase [Nissabacter sp. SGAir0207]QCR35309.1 GNAT family N-acetyltransferase [Nissabacter sp. SGAir0207]
MIIRPYQEADRPFLRTLYLAARKQAWPWLESHDWRLEDFDRAVLGETVLVAEHEGRPVGFASLFEAENFLHNLFVAPEAQGQGAGLALLQAAQETFTSTGALKCLVRNTDALAFYCRHGWHKVSRGTAPNGEYFLLHYPVTR